MDAIALAERRASENADFATLLAEMLSSLERRDHFDLGRLYEASYNDFEVLLGVLYLWRLQRFRSDTLADFRDAISRRSLP